MYGEQRHDCAAPVLCCNTTLFFFLATQHMTFWQCNKFSFTIVLQTVLFIYLFISVTQVLSRHVTENAKAYS